MSYRPPIKRRNTYHINMGEEPEDTVLYRGWCGRDSTLVAIRVKMAIVNTQGAFTLEVKNDTLDEHLLNPATFDMNTLSPNTVTDLTLTSNSAHKAFADMDKWVISVSSDSPEFDVDALTVELVFEA